MTWRSGEKNGFPAMPIWLGKRAELTHYLRFSVIFSDFLHNFIVANIISKIKLFLL